MKRLLRYGNAPNEGEAALQTLKVSISCSSGSVWSVRLSDQHTDSVGYASMRQEHPSSRVSTVRSKRFDIDDGGTLPPDNLFIGYTGSALRYGSCKLRDAEKIVVFGLKIWVPSKHVALDQSRDILQAPKADICHLLPVHDR